MSLGLVGPAIAWFCRPRREAKTGGETAACFIPVFQVILARASEGTRGAMLSMAVLRIGQVCGGHALVWPMELRMAWAAATEGLTGLPEMNAKTVELQVLYE